MTGLTPDLDINDRVKDRTVFKEIAAAAILVLAWVVLCCLLMGLALVFAD